MASSKNGDSEFNFEAHGIDAENAYRRVYGRYAEFSATIKSILAKAIEAQGVKAHSIEARPKSVDSFVAKAMRPREDDASTPKYSDPMTEVKDLSGCRVITFFLKDVEEVDGIIQKQFEVLERANRSSFARAGGGHLGYESMHYIVKLDAPRRQLPEYSDYSSLEAEIQVRTILQHAWAEIEHDVQYKSVGLLPEEIRRRFMALAGMIEIGDREFQAMADAHERLQAEARESIDSGEFEGVEVTPDSLRAYLDRKFGADGRISVWSYSWTAKLLKEIGFSTIEQVDECIEPYDPDKISRAIHGRLQGQLTRLEDAVLAGMGMRFAELHPWSHPDPEVGDGEWFIDRCRKHIAKLESKKFKIGSYVPRSTSSAHRGLGLE